MIWDGKNERFEKFYVTYAIIVVMTVPIIFSLIFSFLLLKPNPQGLNYESPVYSVPNVSFYYDLTYQDQQKKASNQQIFDTCLDAINSADNFILLDMFLFYDSITMPEGYIPIATRIVDALIKKKQVNPEVTIVVITDPFNTSYGAVEAPHLERLKEADVDVVITDLKKLRDSNVLYATLWRSLFQWFGTSGNGWLTNVSDPEAQEVTLRSYLELFNFKANHRKVLVTDKIGIIGSANPHGLSSLHSNIAFSFQGPILADLVKSETAVLELSDFDWEPVSLIYEPSMGDVGIQLLTEKKIQDHLIQSINSTIKGDSIDIAMFYLSSRAVIRSLLRASKRGVAIRLILDPNKDAFGRQKGGVPNRPVASELIRKSKNRIDIRWYNTQGEQFHSKLIIIRTFNTTTVFGGSANLTRRNIKNYNLESNVKVITGHDTLFATEVTTYFNRLWLNQGGVFTTDYSKYHSHSLPKTLLYRFQEFTGLGTF